VRISDDDFNYIREYNAHIELLQTTSPPIPLEISELDYLDWDKMSELGLIEKINREVLYPIGLALFRDVDEGISQGCLISSAGPLMYPSDFVSGLKSNEEIKELLKTIERKKFKDI
jgi:hypothetical protein